jgi:hypothetical protein
MGRMRNSGTICPVTKPSPVALFKGLGNHEIHVIRAGAAKRTFQASQIIIRAEEPAVRLFVPGNAFGFATFLSEPTGYLGTARAAHKTLMWEHRVARQTCGDLSTAGRKRPPCLSTSGAEVVALGAP